MSIASIEYSYPFLEGANNKYKKSKIQSAAEPSSPKPNTYLTNYVWYRFETNVKVRNWHISIKVYSNDLKMITSRIYKLCYRDTTTGNWTVEINNRVLTRKESDNSSFSYMGECILNTWYSDGAMPNVKDITVIPDLSSASEYSYYNLIISNISFVIQEQLEEYEAEDSNYLTNIIPVKNGVRPRNRDGNKSAIDYISSMINGVLKPNVVSVNIDGTIVDATEIYVAKTEDGEENQTVENVKVSKNASVITGIFDWSLQPQYYKNGVIAMSFIAQSECYKLNLTKTYTGSNTLVYSDIQILNKYFNRSYYIGENDVISNLTVGNKYYIILPVYNGQSTERLTVNCLLTPIDIDFMENVIMGSGLNPTHTTNDFAGSINRDIFRDGQTTFCEVIKLDINLLSNSMYFMATGQTESGEIVDCVLCLYDSSGRLIAYVDDSYIDWQTIAQDYPDIANRGFSAEDDPLILLETLYRDYGPWYLICEPYRNYDENAVLYIEWGRRI